MSRAYSPARSRAWTEQLCGFEVSCCPAALDDELVAWRERSLGAYHYVVLDARCEKMRHDGIVVDFAVPLAMGVDNQGKRKLLDVSVALSEAEVHWRASLADLAARGLPGVALLVSDDQPGSRPLARPCSRPWPGNVASSICSRMPATTCRHAL